MRDGSSLGDVAVADALRRLALMHDALLQDDLDNLLLLVSAELGLEQAIAGSIHYPLRALPVQLLDASMCRTMGLTCVCRISSSRRPHVPAVCLNPSSSSGLPLGSRQRQRSRRARPCSGP